MIAALPMYDRPEIRPATDRYWEALRDRLRDRGIAAPDTLTRDPDPWPIWRSRDLIFAQTCGLPFRAELFEAVTLIGTPDYDLPGCPPGHYNSVILSRDATLPDRPTAAINEALSQSGWAALADWARHTGVSLGRIVQTGAHIASVQAVAAGRADLCGVDAQTWRLIQRHAPVAPPLVEIDRTRPTPGLPYITAAGNDPSPIRAAVADAITALTPADRDALDLRGLVQIDAATYRDIPIPPNPWSNAPIEADG